MRKIFPKQKKKLEQISFIFWPFQAAFCETVFHKYHTRVQFVSLQFSIPHSPLPPLKIFHDFFGMIESVNGVPTNYEIFGPLIYKKWPQISLFFQFLRKKNILVP